MAAPSSLSMTARFTRKTRETKWVSFYTYQVSFDLSMTSRCTRRTGERGKTGRDREGLQRERERERERERLFRTILLRRVKKKCMLMQALNV